MYALIWWNMQRNDPRNNEECVPLAMVRTAHLYRQEERLQVNDLLNPSVLINSRNVEKYLITKGRYWTSHSRAKCFWTQLLRVDWRQRCRISLWVREHTYSTVVHYAVILWKRSVETSFLQTTFPLYVLHRKLPWSIRLRRGEKWVVILSSIFLI